MLGGVHKQTVTSGRKLHIIINCKYNESAKLMLYDNNYGSLSQLTHRNTVTVTKVYILTTNYSYSQKTLL